MMMKKELKYSEQKYYIILYNKFSIKNIVYKYIWRMEWRKFFFLQKKINNRSFIIKINDSDLNNPNYSSNSFHGI